MRIVAAPSSVLVANCTRCSRFSFQPLCKATTTWFVCLTEFRQILFAAMAPLVKRLIIIIFKNFLEPSKRVYMNWARERDRAVDVLWISFTLSYHINLFLPHSLPGGSRPSVPGVSAGVCGNLFYAYFITSFMLTYTKLCRISCVWFEQHLYHYCTPYCRWSKKKTREPPNTRCFILVTQW